MVASESKKLEPVPLTPTPAASSVVVPAEAEAVSANDEGYVWDAPVSESAEMLEIMESARQYQNMVQALQTAKQLMMDTLRSN